MAGLLDARVAYFSFQLSNLSPALPFFLPVSEPLVNT